MGEIQQFVDINEIAKLLNRDVDEIEEMVDRNEIPNIKDLEVLTPTGVKRFAVAFPKQEVLSKIPPRKTKRKKAEKKKEEPKTEEPAAAEPEETEEEEPTESEEQ